LGISKLSYKSSVVHGNSSFVLFVECKKYICPQALCLAAKEFKNIIHGNGKRPSYNNEKLHKERKSQLQC
jgi:hypothetical protein